MTAFVIILVFILLYIFIIRPRIKTYRYVAGVLDTIDSGSLHGWALIKAKFAGLKTIILSGVAGVAPTLPMAFDQLKEYTGWPAFFEQATANKVSAACAALAMITHAIGIESAAKTEPKR